MNEQMTTEKLFDIVISVGPNDKDIVSNQVKYTQKNIIGYRNIYIIPFDAGFTLDGCITIPENMFPFSLDTFKQYHPHATKRAGWYLQQLFKLYAGTIIPGILDMYLVIDADTFFLQPTTFIDNNGLILFNHSTECHSPYLKHMNNMHPTLIRMDKHYSGICHHMLFKTKYITELFHLVESYHNCPFYDAFFKCILLPNDSGASEYEIYFNFMLKNHPNEMKLRTLLWKNENSLDAIHNYANDTSYDYLSFHTYLRDPPKNEFWVEEYYFIPA
jgi:uncharacterized short protein YbdD (DUF466 family)